ncbi:hypothetical protein GCM10009792_22230 [Microcella alkalica]|uniref:Uncharacterized protein n=1 Tax=Microcella alkalica TaxID=355930 RepID=A0A839E6Q7_9MICO|nr:hypothetical protein [Microcella alkalica]MBA8848141.1 hypothetical protein [Microcella alkalica]
MLKAKFKIKDTGTLATFTKPGSAGSAVEITSIANEKNAIDVAYHIKNSTYVAMVAERSKVYRETRRYTTVIEHVALVAFAAAGGMPRWVKRKNPTKSTVSPAAEPRRNLQNWLTYA